MDHDKLEKLARIVHEANRAYCTSIGDMSLVSWDDTDDEKKASAVDGVKKVVDNPSVTPEEMHENWKSFKIAQGYSYGDIKDDTAKTHPSITEYSNLPSYQRYKDSLFIAIVKSYLDFVK